VTLADNLGLTISTHYEISPGVSITGDAYQTSNAVARAVIDPALANGVSYVEMLDRGSGYRFATATVNYNSVVPVKTVGANAVIRPIMSPIGGHGYNANSELGASRVCMSVTFNQSVDGFPTINDFRQVGVMTNPTFSNVVVSFTSKDGTFQPAETLYQIDPIRLYGTSIAVTSSSNSVIATSGDFNNSLEAGDKLYLYGSGIRQFATVVSVTNSTALVLDSIGAFSCTDTQLYLANVSNPSTVVSDGVNLVNITGVSRNYVTGSQLIGSNSGAYGLVDNVKVNGTTTDLTKFNGMWRYNINTSDSFEQDEIVYQDSYSLNHGNLFGITGSSNPKTMYVSDQFGVVNTGKKLYGNTSHASADVLDKYQPDIVFNSGRIIYLENLEPVTRSTGQKETFKVIFEY
jgi:hypothetical protein